MLGLIVGYLEVSTVVNSSLLSSSTDLKYRCLSISKLRRISRGSESVRSLEKNEDDLNAVIFKFYLNFYNKYLNIYILSGNI